MIFKNTKFPRAGVNYQKGTISLAGEEAYILSLRIFGDGKGTTKDPSFTLDYQPLLASPTLTSSKMFFAPQND